MKQAFEVPNENIRLLADRLEIQNKLQDLSHARVPVSAGGVEIIAQTAIDLQGDEASSRTLYHYPQCSTATNAKLGSCYQDKWVRTTVGWCIKEQPQESKVY
ncbi:MAG: hypothetical protein ACR2PS_07115 [Pseudomonadales bacterium]